MTVYVVWTEEPHNGGDIVAIYATKSGAVARVRDIYNETFNMGFDVSYDNEEKVSFRCLNIWTGILEKEVLE